MCVEFQVHSTFNFYSSIHNVISPSLDKKGLILRYLIALNVQIGGNYKNFHHALVELLGNYKVLGQNIHPWFKTKDGSFWKLLILRNSKQPLHVEIHTHFIVNLGSLVSQTERSDISERNSKLKGNFKNGPEL